MLVDDRPFSPWRGVELAWAAFALANLAAMFAYPTWVSVPFHPIWISFALLYDHRAWGGTATALALAIITVATGTLIAMEGLQGGIFPERVVEVPLMVTMFAIMAWHIRRYSVVAGELHRVSQANAALAERERRFVQAASHQLRTPITVALGHIELLARAVEDAQSRSDAEIVLEELKRLRGLTTQLLRFEVVTSGATFERSDERVAPMLSDVLHRWDFVDRRWQVQVPSDVRAWVDRRRLLPALDALIDNAVRHTKVGDEITLSADGDQQECRIRVSDSGEGISADQIGHVFDRFHRGDARPGERAPDGGFGLGLALVQEVVRMHGGDVSATSSGGHTSISMTFPRPRTRPVQTSLEPTYTDTVA